MSNLRLTIKQFSVVRTLIQSESYGRLRHSLILRRDHREPDKVFTRFLRLEHQFEALRTKGIDFLEDNNIKQPYRILTLGCSTGAEVWSIIYTLLQRNPKIKFHIHASDISEKILERGRTAKYSMYELSSHKAVDKKFIETMFDRNGDEFIVKKQFQQYADFSYLNVLDNDLMNQVEQADIVYAQNFLYNILPANSEKAFHNIVRLLKDKSLLFIEGMDLPQRYRLTNHYNLKPLDYKIEEIHNDAREVRADGWPYNYWGLEPLSKSRHNWKHYYSTIFFKD